MPNQLRQISGACDRKNRHCSERACSFTRCAFVIEISRDCSQPRFSVVGSFMQKEIAYTLKISQLALKNERLERELNLQEQQIAEMEKIYGESLPSI